MSSETDHPTPDPQPTEAPRPYAGDAGQARAESELWELDAGGEHPSATFPKSQVPLDKRTASARKWVAGPLEKQEAQKKDNRKIAGVRLDVQPRAVPRPVEQLALPSRRVEQEFSQLDDWEVEKPSAPVEAAVPVEPGAGEVSGSDVTDLAAEAPSGHVQSEPDSDTDRNEATPTEEPQPPVEATIKPDTQTVNPRVPMSRVEWAGLLVLFVLIAALAAGAYLWSIHLLPKETPRWQQIAFPVMGERIEIKSAATYWRAPVLEGPDKDPIRRGTRLIPVVELELAGGPAALRVIFRDEEGRAVGDPIIRHMASAGRFALAATAGFNNPGMHAAYRTEELDPWSVEVSEAADVDAAGSDFSQLLNMNLSSDLR